MDPKQLLLKKRQRNALHTNCTKELTKSADFVVPNSREAADEIEVCRAKLNEYRTKLTSLNDELIAEIENDDEGMAEAQEAAVWDDRLLEASTLLALKLKTFNEPRLSAPVEAFGSHHSLTSSKSAAVKLPKLEIAKFSGEALKWQEFWDSFSSTIHSNTDLSPIDKFKYLIIFLDGDALRMVQGYRLTSENYETAVEILKERYGNPQLAIFSHFEAMLALPVVTNHDTQQLQKTFDNCERHIRSLIALGLPEETFGQVFTPIILSKLPLYVKMEVHRRNGDKPWTLQNLRELLKEEIRVRNVSHHTIATKPASESAKPKDDKKNSKTTEKQPKGAGSSASLLADSSTNKTGNQTKKAPKCSFCGGGHYSDACTKFPDLKSRRENLKGRCFKCLSSRHAAKECTINYNCVHCKSNRHHRALCSVKFGEPDTSTAACVDSQVESLPANQVNSTLLSHNERVILQTSLTKIKATTTHSAHLLFDTGCSRTFITSKMAKLIGARSIGNEVVSIAGFSDTKRKTIKYPIVEFDVMQMDGTELTLTANVTPTISCPVQQHPIDVAKHPIVKQLVLSEPLCTTNQMVTIDVLIGNDYYYDIVGSERIRCPDGLIFLSSTVGFIATGRIGGPNSSPEKEKTVSSFLLAKSDVDVRHDTTFQVEKFWSLEDIGVKTPSSTNEDEEALNHFNATVKYENGRYAVKWPWRKEAPELPENYHLALGRLRSLMKKLKQDETLLKTYDQTIKDQETKGVVEKVETLKTEHKVHYIPHHCVVTPGKATTKVRIVYDASAKQNKDSPSLNECLHRGPVLLDDLCGLLMRFRLHNVALVSDIEKAFLQVALQDDSKDVTRFLWLKDLSKPPDGDNLVVYRFCRVAFGVKSSPFLLTGTVQHHANVSNSPVGEDIKNDIYVDNVFGGKSTVEEAISFYRNAKDFFTEASMNLREWFTNSSEVNDVIKDADRGKTTETTVLGMLWNTNQDVLSCSSFSVKHEAINTKRLMLKYLAKVFDPCGYFSAVTVAGKMLIQKLWKENYGWDDKLPEEILHEWSKVAPGLEQLSGHKMKRCLLEDHSGCATYSLHCFCDASAKAYAAVVYLVESTHDRKSANIIFAKSRVAPVKTMSIPRLELMALLIGTRLIAFVETQLRIPLTAKYVWSDSQCVLHWIVKPVISTVFVKNRISEIKGYTGIQFRYVPTEQNPADISSRGCSYEQIVDCDKWWKGPEFLKHNEDSWPRNISTKEPEEEIIHDVSIEHGTTNQKENMLLAVDEDFRLKPKNYSSLTRLLRVTAWMKRFISNCRKVKSRCSGELSAAEMSEARRFWELRIQKQHFSVSKPDQLRKRYKQLDVFVDQQGLLRCGTRLKFADIEASAKQPILLPKDCEFTNLVILDRHASLLHDGIAHTLALVRTRYWIVHGRPQVRRAIGKCRVCKLRYGGPFKVPKFPPLPEFRVTRQKPFSTVGIDYLGPLKIKNSSTAELQKIWICIFTCAAVRAIHLEVIEQLTAQQFMLCLRRFMAKYCVPSMIVCDNAKYFKATKDTFSKIWRQIQNDSKVQAFAANKEIRWKFITEFAPWMGGFYERLVGIVKRALKTSLDSRCVSLIELQTVVSEVCAIVNSRPLLYSETDLSDAALTPAHFLGGTYCGLPTINDTDENFEIKQVKSDDLVKYYKRLQKIIDSFWSCWRNQYLVSLRAHSNYHKQRNVSSCRPAVGAVVLLKDNAPRCQWRMGIISSLKTSDDGQVRSAQVKIPNGNILNRPIKLLFPLELSLTESPYCARTESPRRSTREAARTAAQRIKSGFESPDDSPDQFMASQYYPFSSDHLFSRFSVHCNPKLLFGGIEFLSIEAIFWYCVLIQQHNSNLANRMRQNRIINESPQEIATWVKNQGEVISAEWKLRASYIYIDIILSQLNQHGSPINLAFKLIVEESSDPSGLKFVSCSAMKDHTWDCGYRLSVFQRKQKYLGVNCYGMCWTLCLQRFLKNKMTPIIAHEAEYYTKFLSKMPPYENTIALLSDSQCCVVKEINGGYTRSISGGTFRDMQTNLQSLHIGSFAIVIVNCGINDVQRPQNQWNTFWQNFETVLLNLKNENPSITFIISLPMAHPTIPGVRAYCRFIRRRLLGTGILCLDWHKVIKNPFACRTESEILLDPPNFFHINHTGFARMWEHWALLEKQMMGISYKLATRAEVAEFREQGNYRR